MTMQLLFNDMGVPDDISSFRSGKDEMNFAEFPIALLTDKVPKGQKVIKFEDEIYDEKRKRIVHRRRIIEGSEEYGLPTATDDLVILALIQLTKIKGDFTNREVQFTRLELINMLGWADEGRNFDRIKLSLLRIKLVNYVYDNAWWDSRQKTWTTKAFSLIDNVEINDSRTNHGQRGLFPSRIVWNEVVFDSFQAGFLRNIDFRLCMRLEYPTALRMYRFLGKRFYVRPEWVFDLKEFAYNHLNLGRNYEGGTQIARKLKPAITELESVGFLEPLAEKDRFIKKGREWSIRLIQKSAVPAALPSVPPPAKPEQPLVAELVKRGVTKATAAELVQRHQADAIEAKLEVFDWLAEKPDKRVEKSPAGYLVKSIEKDYATPQGFVSRAERQRREEEGQARERQAAEERRRKQQVAAQERADDEATAAYREALTPGELARHEAAAIAQASDAERSNLDDPALTQFRKTLVFKITNTFILQIIRKQQSPPSHSPAP